jgi:hypothetical protein
MTIIVFQVIRDFYNVGIVERGGQVMFLNLVFYEI